MGRNSGYVRIPVSISWYPLTHFDPINLKSQKGTYPYEPGLIEAPISPQSEQWTEDMTEEFTNLVKRRTWDVVRKSEVPEGAKIIKGTWDFKCKHFPNGSFQTFKAWFCVKGFIHKIISVVPMNTYVPVVQ